MPAAYLSSEDDDAALAAAAAGDRLEFMRLYDRYVGRIERYVLARTRNPSDADDLVSATFERALARIHTYRPQRGTFAAWLFTIARNVVNDHFRRQRHVYRSDTPDQADQAAGPEAQALRGEEAVMIERALQTLTPEQRDALALRYASGLPFADVARTLGKSEPAAKMLVQRGLRGLREHLQEKPES